VAVVLDGRQGILYLNGQAVAVNNSVNLLPSDILPNRIWFGRSEFPADPYLGGRLDSLFLNSTPVDPAEIKRHSLSPALLSETISANQVTLSWPSWDRSMQLYGSTNLGAAWLPVTNQPVISSSNLSVTLPSTVGPQFYRLQWP
jgi:hypothetical protein